MAKEWYYSQNGQRHGPVSSADLKQLAASGKLHPTDHVWKEGMDKWAAARSVKGLFPPGGAPVATKAPPPPLPARKPPHLVESIEVADAEPGHAIAERPARADGPLGWAAAFWRRSSTPAKIGIVGGGAAGVLLLGTVLVFVSVALFGRSGGDAKVNRS